MSMVNVAIRDTYKLALSGRIASSVYLFTERSSVRGLWRLRRFARWIVPNRLVVAETAYGFAIIVNPREDEYQAQMFVHGTYEPATLRLMTEYLRQGDVVMDVGANIGLMSLHAARLVGPEGRVWSFEPSPFILERLQENIALNGFENVISAINVALGDRSEVREVFRYPGVNLGRTSLIHSGGGVADGKVAVDTVDHVVSANGIDEVRFLKVDVEGFELQVLRGAQSLLKSAAPPILCVEMSRDIQRDTGAAMECAHKLIMQSNEYRCFRFADTKFKESRLAPLADIGSIGDDENLIYLPAHVETSCLH
jgi:FkbM family methyltransferase